MTQDHFEGQIAMKLEFHIVKIQDIQFGNDSNVDKGVLTINRDELKALLEGDRRLSKVDIEIAHPGEKCRILQVGDVIEPRFKMDGDQEDVLGPARQPTYLPGCTCPRCGSKSNPPGAEDNSSRYGKTERQS